MKTKIILIIFIVFLIIGIFIQFINFDYIINKIGKDFSSDGIIESDTYSYYENKFQTIKILLIIIPLLFLTVILFRNKIESTINILKIKIPILIKTVYSKLSIKHLFWVSIIFIFIISIYAVYNFDISEDESYFINDVQNINSYGSVYRDFGDNKSFYFDIPNLPLNLISNISVPLFGFSVAHVRLIILFFSLILIPLIFFLLNKSTAQLTVIFLFLFPGIFSLTSTVFTEFIAIFFFVLSLVLLKLFEDRNKNHILFLSALFMAVSMATKIQFAFWIVMILIILFIIDHKRSYSLLIKYSLLIFLSYLLILTISFFHYGIHNGILLFKYVFLGDNQSWLINFNWQPPIHKLLMLNNLIFIPFLLFIWIKSWKIIKEKYDYLYMRIIFIGAISILLYWLLAFNVLTLRNAILGIAFNFILIALYLKDNNKSIKLVLIPYIIVGISANYALINMGVNNNIQMYYALVLDNLITVNKNEDQKIFYSKVAEIVKPENDLFVPAQYYTPKIYLNNRIVKPIKKYVKSDNIQFIITTPADVKEHLFEHTNIKSYLSISNKILQIGGYELYQIQY